LQVSSRSFGRHRRPQTNVHPTGKLIVWQGF
jgi:hypothetical protein